jgi:hypothetical protein
LYSETRDFVFKKTLNDEELRKYQEEEKRKKGLEYKNIKTKNKNYKDLQEEIKVNKKLKKNRDLEVFNFLFYLNKK